MFSTQLESSSCIFFITMFSNFLELLYFLFFFSATFLFYDFRPVACAEIYFRKLMVEWSSTDGAKVDLSSRKLTKTSSLLSPMINQLWSGARSPIVIQKTESSISPRYLELWRHTIKILLSRWFVTKKGHAHIHGEEMIVSESTRSIGDRFLVTYAKALNYRSW